VKVEVLSTVWGHDDGQLDGGVHEIEKPSGKLLKALAAAEAAGSVKITASRDERARMGVETDAESLKRLEAAQKDGSWQAGNHLAYVADAKARLKDPDLPDGQRAGLEHGVRVSTAYLKARAGKLDHEAAVAAALVEVQGG
jgi:hypothetical protein